MKELGKITKTEGEYAYVALTKGLCGDGCAACMASCKKAAQLRVRNTAKAAVGEAVTVSRSPGRSVLLALFRYALPLVMFFAASYFTESDWVSFALLLLSFALCAFGASLLEKTKYFIYITGRL